MEKIYNFFINNWIIVLVVNGIAILFIIFYLLEEHRKAKENNKIEKNNEIIFDNANKENQINEKIIDNGKKILVENNNSNVVSPEISKEINKYENNNDELTNKNIQEEKTNNINQDKKDTTIIREEDNKSLKEKLDVITNSSNDVFNEFDKIISTKSIIDDKTKELFEMPDDDDKDKFKSEKKDINIDTDIKLPNITLSTEEKDIWD